AGIISAKGRTQFPGTQSLTDYLQTDASINRGNSGGALVNLKGELVGINTWIASQNGGSIGLGFSIPINNAKSALEDFINNGGVQYGWLGIHMGDLSQRLIEELSLNYQTGVMVYNIYQDSPAMIGGISPGDLIISIDSVVINNSNDVTNAIANRPPGDQIEVTFVRDNQELTSTITLGLRETQENETPRGLWPGFTVAPLSRDLRARMDLPRNTGNIVIGYVDPNSKAGALGLQSGDVIKSLNSRNIKDIADFYDNLRDQQSLNITIIRRGYELEYQLSL
ncbi:MAG: PDZ domain-containing protein, partial [Spirochaetaceae bacterium]|nr:PDZ domain-containing protein [Spirochaetaceae bacterium]